jgi:hypothetical protein
MGYGYWLIDNMHVLVSFAGSGDEDTSTDITKLSSEAALKAAAQASVNAALKTKEALEAAEKE